jgi:hypothetical protein
MEQKFEAFPDIKKLGTAALFITQKIHGSNAQIYIFKNREYLRHLNSTPDDDRMAKFAEEFPGKNLVVDSSQNFGTVTILYNEFMDLACGSRTRWIAPGNDNYGFAEFVYANKQEFIDKLGHGRHYGEWAGPGINSGEGLKEKTFVLFDHWRYPSDRPLPPRTVVVPVLYAGAFDLSKVQECMDDLKTNGSKLVPGYMRPEGVVVKIKGERYKVVFNAEETQWKDADPEYQKNKSREQNQALEKYGHLLQPIRLEKLLSRDEAYLKEYPKSMPQIVKDYFADLVKEDQVKGTDAEISGIRKQLGGHLFKFVQETVEKQNAL